MSQPLDFEPAFERARKLHAEGRLSEAEQAYRQLAVPDERREPVLAALADLYLDARRPKESLATLAALTRVAPDSLPYCAQLANLLESLGQTDAAIAQYLRLLKRQPALADGWFNLALLYKASKRHADALGAYEEAIRLGIDGVEEAWSNMGVLYSELRQADKAREMYEHALAVDPRYIPALFNLAGLVEETGARDEAVELYRRILAIDPGYSAALARLTHASRLTSADDKLIESLRASIDDKKEDATAREEIWFALGKALDDLGQYDEAFAAYRSANELGKLRSVRYDRQATGQMIERLIGLSNADWIERSQTGSAARPIFICGMFRSGSTLVEQILAAHPSVTAGGELDYLPWLVARTLSPYPERLANVSLDELQELGSAYLSRLAELFPDAANVTDKRPDNFLYLGVIKALFPAARIVYTRRNPLDNCLSVYFQHLGEGLSYATDLGDIAHYYRQHERLLAHWQTLMPHNMVTVDYDSLVRSPESVTRDLIRFLELEWDDRCLAFQSADSPVKTASVWQVREQLHTASSGRWRNYEPFVRDIEVEFSEQPRAK